MSSMQDLLASSYLSAGGLAYIEALYQDYLMNPSSVSADWQAVFSKLSDSEDSQHSFEKIEAYFKYLSTHKQQLSVATPLNEHSAQGKVNDWIQSYRSFGHLMAKLNPLSTENPVMPPQLSLAYFGLDTVAQDELFELPASLSSQALSIPDIQKLLQTIYADHIGLEYAYIPDEEQVRWFQNQFESCAGHLTLSSAEKKQLLEDLIAADGFERYLQTRFVGQKRFSLEGGDALIPMLRSLMNMAASQNVKDVIIGMAHRGRLNVLVNVLGKAPKVLFDEFAGKFNGNKTGDVKYHLGYSSDLICAKNKRLHAILAFNPSHLEIISPVVEGAARSRLCVYDDLEEKNSVIPVLIHGDSAFTGQGVVMETFNFSQTRYYSTGGSIHIVINNQVGFTTSNPKDTRSSLYCTDIAKMVQAPIIHVNGDAPEDVLLAIRLAFDYRMKFKRDVVIDLVCYRRLGHNEADEASLTQPLMYKNIRARSVLRDIYAHDLMAQAVVDAAWYKQAVDTYRDHMDKGEPLVAVDDSFKDAIDSKRWLHFIDTDWTEPAVTGVAKDILVADLEKLCEIPAGFQVHPVVQRTLSDRLSMAKGELGLNWGCAELLAYASLLQDGYEIRLSGQDCGRGTFSHRHAIWHDQNNDAEYCALKQFQQKPFTVIDSVLSEEAVLAFEYGYASQDPNALVIWEAQFGDFVNGAQVVIDQFISSGEQKWGRLCGLVMFLPHGYEGQGPEHSSARLERFMQLCAEQNIQVCVPSTPAQIFHLLRRQMRRPYRKPLIVMTPKSLLRHKLAVSSLDELVHGQFQNIIPETDDLNPKHVEKIILCSGKVYYDLYQARQSKNITNAAIIRIEQLYPFAEQELKAIFASYPKAKKIVWCQEEPQNQGAWYTSQHHVLSCMQSEQKLFYAGRESAAAPAVGSPYLHAEQQQALVEDAFKL